MKTKYQISYNQSKGIIHLYEIINTYEQKLVYWASNMEAITNFISKQIIHKTGIDTVMHITLEY